MAKSVNASYVQQTHRFVDDDAANNSATLLGANGDDRSYAPSATIRIRFLIQQTVATANNDLTVTPQLHYQYNGTGGYILIGEPADTDAPIRVKSIANITDGTATAARIGAGTFVAGTLEDSASSWAAVTFTTEAATETEWEIALEIYSGYSGLANNDTIDLRVYRAGAVALDGGYTDTPRVTVIGAQTLTQSSRFDNSASFYTHTLTPGAVTLTQSSRFDDSDSFYTHTLTQAGGTQTLTQSSRFDDSDTFYAHTLTPGSVTLTQSSRFDNAQSFYTHTLTASITLTQSARYDDADSFYTHTLTAGAVTLTQSSRFDNAATFYAHSLTASIALTQSSRFDDGDTFYAHTLTLAGGTQTLTQSSRFDDGDTFYAHALSYDQTLTQSSRFDDADSFYTQVVRNQYPDPSEVLIGVEYGEPGLILTGTRDTQYDGSLKVDVTTGKMVKLITNKVAITL